MVHNIMDAARWFTDRNGGRICTGKLHKLCYYAQAWSYAHREKALFFGPFQAWERGPTNKRLWETFQNIETNEITAQDFDNLRIPLSPFPTEEEGLLEQVWNAYGNLTSCQLETLVCGEEPWLEKWNSLQQGYGASKTIAVEAMKKYYKSKFVDM